MKTSLIKIENSDYKEIKDPSILRSPFGHFEMYASVGTSDTQTWEIGRFEAGDPRGPWQMLETIQMHGLIEGPGVRLHEACAPSVEYDLDHSLYVMHVQTACFTDGCYIARLVSQDGANFHADSMPAYSKENFVGLPHDITGLYDVAISNITYQGKEQECMVFSGYRNIGREINVGCGDIYASLREKGKMWGPPQLILRQEDVPFHNRPGSITFEWGLEGGKVFQLAENLFGIIVVGFLDEGICGTRQRAFFAASHSPIGQFKIASLPFEPTLYPEGQGENGHPDIIDMAKHWSVVYQERAGFGKPWHLRYAEFPKGDLIKFFRAALCQNGNSPAEWTGMAL